MSDKPDAPDTLDTSAAPALPAPPAAPALPAPSPPPASRLTQQLAFLVQADALKQVVRRTPLVDSSRRENSAEHSWHLGLTAIVMAEYAASSLDLLRVLKMLALHDLVEIDAGDVFAYDHVAQAHKAERERTAADRIFGLLPLDQAAPVRALWDEFEAQETIESRFANAVDRIQPLLQDVSSGGGTCHNRTRVEVLQRMAPVESATPALWPKVLEIVDSLCAAGVIRTFS